MKKTYKVRAMCYTINATGETYLSYISYDTLENLQKEADKINKEHPDRLITGEKAFCEERTYFAQEQDEF